MTNEELTLKIQAGEKELLPQLWEQCLRFIRKEARRWSAAFASRPDIDTEDLVQSGYIALVEAVECFDPDKGSFINFLVLKLKTAFSVACRVRTAVQQLDPLTQSSLRFEMPVGGEDDGRTLGETLPDPQNNIADAEESIYREYVAATVRKAVDSLKEQQRVCITLFYLDGKPQKEIAQRLNVSASRVQFVTREALGVLRHCKYTPELWELYSPNYYAGTSYAAFKATGLSSPERILLRKEWAESVQRRSAL